MKNTYYPLNRQIYTIYPLINSLLHKTLPKSGLLLHWTSVRFYEMGDMTRVWVLFNSLCLSKYFKFAKFLFCGVLYCSHSLFNSFQDIFCSVLCLFILACPVDTIDRYIDRLRIRDISSNISTQRSISIHIIWKIIDKKEVRQIEEFFLNLENMKIFWYVRTCLLISIFLGSLKNILIFLLCT